MGSHGVGQGAVEGQGALLYAVSGVPHSNAARSSGLLLALQPLCGEGQPLNAPLFVPLDPSTNMPACTHRL